MYENFMLCEIKVNGSTLNGRAKDGTKPKPTKQAEPARSELIL